MSLIPRTKTDEAYTKAAEILSSFGIKDRGLEKFLAMELIIWYCDGGIAAIDRQIARDKQDMERLRKNGK